MNGFCNNFGLYTYLERKANCSARVSFASAVVNLTRGQISEKAEKADKADIY